jgi:pimeloyl-ACP methyl ester carboxylesterase
MQVVVDHLLTHYEVAGKGKLVLLLHGWGDSSAGSLALQKALAAKYRVLTPDLPGFGKTQAPETTWNLDDYGRFVAALLKKLDLGQPYAIIGHSNGGSVAIRACALGLLQPKKLVLMASAGIRTGGGLRRTLLLIAAKAGNVATLGLPARYRNALRRQLYKSAGSDALVVENLKDTFAKTVRQDVQADAAQLAQPTLLLFGDHDTAVPLAHGERYAQLIPNARLTVISPSGHFVHLDQPAAVTGAILEFLA